MDSDKKKNPTLELVEPATDAGQQKVDLAKNLKEAQSQVEDLVSKVDQKHSLSSESWNVAREIVEQINPVPWFIWRISNYVFNNAEKSIPESLPEGMVFGLRKLLFAIASDPILGSGSKVNQTKKALNAVEPDTIAAAAILYAICRKMKSFENYKTTLPILNDAIVRAQLGAILCSKQKRFPKGKGMLAGFAGRCGLVMLLNSRGFSECQETLSALAEGRDINQVCQDIYGCQALQVSALTLSAAGCGKDAAFGTVAYAAQELFGNISLENEEQSLWLKAFILIEKARLNKLDTTSEEIKDVFSLDQFGDPDNIAQIVKKTVRRGHGWQWML